MEEVRSRRLNSLSGDACVGGIDFVLLMTSVCHCGCIFAENRKAYLISAGAAGSTIGELGQTMSVRRNFAVDSDVICDTV